ncbi:dihydropteroate synthase [Desulfofundulus thermosubterraneus]|uniref:Dihydropteroate synthase n=1 Tax=Desulfofundulus thermosubterraneus DSM 16057 TaxID=1121432 RepID=A0A1M6DY68_9FIRM|nr:dihydropteroate synthase [Desulfofundulus thermosubterraneus]SHI78151.1 dihydropteroate synthase [Desulfofundulus thermosubterraneus DSM 16057]
MPVQVRNIEIKNRAQALKEIAAVGADQAGCRLMAPKAVHRVLKISGLTPVQANILKQEMLAKGGEAAVARGVVDHAVDKTDVLLMGTLKQFDALLAKLKMQPFGLPALAEEIRRVLQHLEGRPARRLNCRGKELVLGERTLVMGILNVTPDSFSDGGRFSDPSRAVEHAHRLVEDGADIIDLGGESTRPGYTPVTVDEEMRRVIPVLEKLVQEIPVPISVDTTKAAVAREALEIGAHIINDQWALRADPEMAAVVARYDVPVILMHNQRGTEYEDLMGDMIHFFRESIALALEAGICRDKIIIDPGIGFGKTVEQNLEVMSRLSELDCLGLPVLLGTSRKSMIGKTLDLPVDQRVEGTAATVAVGIAAGVDIVRVHDVKEMVRVARMTDAMVRRKPVRCACGEG